MGEVGRDVGDMTPGLFVSRDGLALAMVGWHWPGTGWCWCQPTTTLVPSVDRSEDGVDAYSELIVHNHAMDRPDD